MIGDLVSVQEMLASLLIETLRPQCVPPKDNLVLIKEKGPVSDLN